MNGVKNNVFKVSECLELMESINNLSRILDSKSDLIPEVVYLELYNEMKKMYETELIVKVDTYSQKKQRKRDRPTNKHTKQQYVNR